MLFLLLGVETGFISLMSLEFMIARVLLLLQLPYFFAWTMKLLVYLGVLPLNPLEILVSYHIFLSVDYIVLMVSILYIIMFIQTKMASDDTQHVWDELFQGGERSSPEDEHPSFSKASKNSSRDPKLRTF